MKRMKFNFHWNNIVFYSLHQSKTNIAHCNERVSAVVMATHLLCLTKAFFFVPTSKWCLICFFPDFYTSYFFCVFVDTHRHRVLVFQLIYLTFLVPSCFYSLIGTVHFCWRLMQDIKLFIFHLSSLFVPHIFFIHVSVRICYQCAWVACGMRAFCKNTTVKFKGELLQKKNRNNDSSERRKCHHHCD